MLLADNNKIIQFHSAGYITVTPSGSAKLVGVICFMKMKIRKAFNFYRSYYDVAKELPEKDRLLFLWAVIQKQFDGIEPELKGQSNFAYISQKHNIDTQVAGYESKTGIRLTPTEPPCQPPTEPPTVQEKEKEKGQVQEKEKVYRAFAHLKLLEEDFEKLLDLGYEKYQIDNTLDSIENYKKNNNYKSLFLTAKKWLEKEKSSAKKEKDNGQERLNALSNWGKSLEHDSSS